MLDSESPSTRYRRLAQECWETAHTFPDGERRIALLQMAQVWQRLAVDHADSTPLLRPQPCNSNSRRDAPDFVEVGEAGVAVGHAMRRQRRVQLVG
jgi:hypothetical protein